MKKEEEKIDRLIEDFFKRRDMVLKKKKRINLIDELLYKFEKWMGIE